jgi:hypothetical protein
LDTGVVHARQYEGRVLQLEMTGTTGAGNVRDVASGLLWVQESGEGHQGQNPLAKVPSVMQTWREWRSAHPESDLMLTPANLDEPATSAVVSAHLFSISGIAWTGQAIGQKLLTPLSLMLMSSALLSFAVILRRRQPVEMAGPVAEAIPLRLEKAASAK